MCLVLTLYWLRFRLRQRKSLWQTMDAAVLPPALLRLREMRNPMNTVGLSCRLSYKDDYQDQATLPNTSKRALPPYGTIRRAFHFKVLQCYSGSLISQPRTRSERIGPSFPGLWYTCRTQHERSLGERVFSPARNGDAKVNVTDP